MGIYDRDYYRGDGPSGMQVGSPQSVTVKLIIVCAVLFFADSFLGGPNHDLFRELMSVSPNILSQPWLWWKFVTYGFAHFDFGHVFWNMLGLWFFGRDVEVIYGKKEYLCYYLGAIILGGVLWSLRHFMLVDPAAARPVLIGASGGVTAVIMLFVLHYPNRTILLMMVLPVPAWVLGVMMIGTNVLGLVGPSEHIAFDVHLVGVAFAILYFRFGWRISPFLPGQLKPSFRWFKSRPKLRVHSSDDEESEKSYGSQDSEADRVLDKVHQEGEESLSAKERRILEAYSRRMRQKHR